MSYPDILAYIATILNLVILAPQVIRAYKTKHTDDLSLTSLFIFLTACVLWTIYGIAKNAPPIIIANSIVGVTNLSLIIIKLKYSNSA